jgi:hypothetical protein
MNHNKKHKKIYRFALYGLSGSGKTCLLAALAMPRSPHPLGYSCILPSINDVLTPLEEPNKDEADIEDEINESDKRLTILRHSQEWMENIIFKLFKQEIPPSNPTSDDPFIFEYDFTASTHQTFRIELIDYSGQLINPAVSNTQLAKRLRQKFAEMDGILVLANAPFRNGSSPEQNPSDEQPPHNLYPYTELYPLRQAFGLLRSEGQATTLDTPVALLINKWDRYSHIDYINPANEQTKLEEFLNANPPPPHKGLSDVLRYSVTDGHFKTFPVSALGETECVSLGNGKIVEQPKQVEPLNAFGLEDAFIWLAQRRDVIDFEQFKAYTVARGPNEECRQMGMELLERFPRGSDQAIQINSILLQCQKVKKSRTRYTIIIAIALLFAVEIAFDVISWKYWEYTIDKSYVTHKQLEATEKWLTQYTTAPRFRHLISKYFFFSQDEAKKFLTQLQERQEKHLWTAVENAQKINVQSALEPALTYLKYYPSGLHTEAAQTIKKRAEHYGLQQAIHQLESRLEAYQQKPDKNPDKLNQLLEELHALPVYQETDTDEMRQLRETLATRILEQQTQILEQQVIQKMQAGELEAAQAAVKLLSKQPNSRQFEEMQCQINERLNKKRDEELYKAAITIKNEGHIQNYLQNAPLKTMKKEMFEYLKYLERINTDIHGLRLKLIRIKWADVNDYDNTVIVKWNDKEIIRDDTVEAEPQTEININKISREELTAKPVEPITLMVTVTNDDMFFDDDYGSGTVTSLVSELVHGEIELELKSAEGVKTGVAFLEITGGPKAPSLPKWRYSPNTNQCVKTRKERL